jgi:hypothetical protein
MINRMSRFILLSIITIVSLPAFSQQVPYVNFKLPVASFCKDTLLTFTNLGNTKNAYSWRINNVLVSNTYHLSTKALITGVNTIKLTVDSSGFNNSIEKQLKIDKAVDVYKYIRISDTAVCQHASITLTISSSSSNTYYELFEIITNKKITGAYGNGTNLLLRKDSIINSGQFRIVGSNICSSVAYDIFKVRVKPTPNPSISYSFKDTLFCNKGIPKLKIKNTEPSVNYTVYYGYSNVYLSGMGNGADIDFTLPETKKSMTYTIIPINTISSCQRSFVTNKIIIDTVIANFWLNKINLYINEPLKGVDNSYGSSKLSWLFYDQTNTLLSGNKNVSKSYSTVGYKKIKLVNETQFGCKDSIEKTINVNDTSNYISTSWNINGARIENWEGHASVPSFDIDQFSNSYVAGEFTRSTAPNIMFNSVKGKDFSVDNFTTGTFICRYDKFGLLKWHNLIIGNTRPEILCLKTIQDSLIFLSITASPTKLYSTDGAVTAINKTNIIAVYNLEGKLLKTINIMNPVTSVETDKNKNIYFVFSKSSNGNCIVSKYNSSLDSLWSVKFKHSYFNNERDPKITIDEDGSVAVIGCLDDDMDVIGTNGTFRIKSSRTIINDVCYTDIFLFKLNYKGEYQWGNIGFTNSYVSTDRGIDVKADKNNNIYIIGQPSTNRPIYLTSSDSRRDTLQAQNYFLAKYSSDGKYKWGVGAKMTTGGYWVSGNKIFTDKTENIYVLGYLKHSCNLTSTDTAKSYHFTKEGEEHFFIANYNFNGVLKRVWITKKQMMNPQDIKMDKDSNTYLLLYNNGYHYNYNIINSNVDMYEQEYLLTKLNKYYNTDTIKINSNFTQNYCKNESLQVGFTQKGTEALMQIFQAELSDNKGLFKNSSIIGNLETNKSTDIINCQIPQNIQEGNQYRIRVNNKTIGSIGKDNGSDITFHRINAGVKTVDSVLCNNDSLLIGGIYHSNPGIYYDTVHSSTSCDYVVKYILRSRKNSINITECHKYISPSGRYVWRKSGTYNDTIQIKSGCDSIITVNLTIKNNIASKTITACRNYKSPSGKYTWTTSGIYNDTIPDSFGCDSIITMNLTIKNGINVSRAITACKSYKSPSGKYTWTTSGIYNDTIPDSFGCDSIITVNLTVKNGINVSRAITACKSYKSPSGKYTWTTSGIYNDTIPDSFGCDSIITVNLTIKKGFNVSRTITACKNYKSPSGKHIWTTSGMYNDTIPNSYGCDSIVTVNLTIKNGLNVSKTITACKSYKSPSGKYIWTTSGIYNDTVPNSFGCDSVITLNLTINKVNTSVTIENSTLKSNAIGSVYQWLDCNNNYNSIIGMTNQSYAVTANGSYAVKVITNNCIDTSNCYVITSVGISDNVSENILIVYPNPTSGNFYLDPGSNNNILELFITDSFGKLVKSTVYHQGKVLVLEINEPAGIYLLKLKTENKISVIKLIKY